MRRRPSGCTSSGTSFAVLDARRARSSPGARRAPRARRCAARARGCGSSSSSGGRLQSSSRSAASIFSAYVMPSAGCGVNVGSGSTSSSSSTRELARRAVDGAGVVLGLDRERALRGDRPRVELGLDSLMIVTPVSAVAGHQRPLDRRRAAPARQQRRVDVEPERPRESRLGNQHARRPRRRPSPPRVEVRLEPLGLDAPGCRAAPRPPSPAAARPCARGPAAGRAG